jgi:Fur family transcriptional regulator, peroxide stress response regulator
VAVPLDEVERRVGLIGEALRVAGFRVTHQRMEVAREVASSDVHPDVETVHRAVRGRIPAISLDTVYRTLAEFDRLGLVTQVHATSRASRYDANRDSHHHFVCRGCGLIRDVYSEALDSLGPPESEPLPGRVERVEVRFQGLCDECVRKEQDDE